MKTRILSFKSAALCSVMLLFAAAKIQGTSIIHPARFGVIDIIPNELSAESAQDCEPSLAVGLNVNHGKMAVHAFTVIPHNLTSTVYISSNTGDVPWTAPWSVYDLDATMDWSAGGNCYLALMPDKGT